MNTLTWDIYELESAFLDEKYDLLRQNVYSKFLKMRFLKALRKHSRQNKKIAEF